MKPNPVHRLPAPLEAAVQRLKLAAREAVERTIESLGLAALAAHNAYQRDGLLGAQFELNRKSAVFVLTFNDAFDERMLRELGPRGDTGNPASTVAPQPTEWASLSLVEDREVEALISAERFGLEIQHACEWELRELEGYVSALLGEAGGERDRSPLRPEIVGHAMIRGIEAVTDRAENRKVLSAELSRSLGGLLRTAYSDIVAELRSAGVQPMGLMVRNRGPRGAGGGGSQHAGLGEDSRHASGYGDDRGPASHLGVGPGARDSRYSSHRSGHSAFGHSAQASHSGYGSGYASRYGSGHGGRGGTAIGQVDPALMSLIRRLAYTDGGLDSGIAGLGSTGGGSGSGPLPPNLIRAHREELRQASNGGLDHMVIDVIGFLFDQIMADPKVPPQLARQIARLQLPVLRAALGDPTFFSSRRHPVRRFVNRIASLGAAFEDFDEEGAKAFLGKVRGLVQEVVEGDFDQIEIYEQKLAALEAFTAELADRDSQGGDAAALLSEKEDQQRLSQLYAQRLAGELKDLAAPPFLREFLSGVWGQVLLRATEQDGPEGALATRLRHAGRELFLSVQPKGTPGLRKAFLTELPRLMQDLSDGMNLIGWPEVKRRAFFGQLMPAHAEALKAPGARQLDINLMARQVEGALQRPPPSKAELKAMPSLPVLTEEIAPPVLSADEARQVGLLQEAAVDWAGKVDIDISANPAERPGAELDLGLPDLPGLPMLAEPPDPTEGRALADHVQVGFAYHMNVDGHWHKVRLSHISPARTFFIFTHGSRHKKTISLTLRMLQRLCETGRLKAFENGYLLERATARARRQLSALGGGAAAALRPPAAAQPVVRRPS